MKSDSMDKIITKTNGGFDVVIECCGNGPAVSEALMAVKPGGTVVLVGVSYDSINVPSILLVTKEVRVLGAIAYTNYDFDTCLQYIANKTINVTKYIDDLVDLDDAQKSFERLTSGRDAAVKIIFKP